MPIKLSISWLEKQTGFWNTVCTVGSFPTTRCSSSQACKPQVFQKLEVQ